jgi:hypothetical protein
MKTKSLLLLFTAFLFIIWSNSKKINMMIEKISQFPFKLKSSKDNIVLVADYLTENGCNNIESQKSLFIINSQYINVFDRFNPKLLVNSVSFKDLVKSRLPFTLRKDGGKHILNINKKGAMVFSIGLNDKEKIDQVLKVVQSFIEYQKGNPIVDEDSLKPCKLGGDIGKVEDGSEYLLNYNK